ncbi:MAG: hypothetical protein D6760_08375 [Deltaproteobacteria bacterium]|nr:MAG: hypothetical protein D6760_08375 [Deltaproteobacteria bacterium]
MASLAIAGCVVVPVITPEHGLLAGHGAIEQAEAVRLEPGETTREDVLLRFGEPSASLDGDRVFVYHWQTALGYVLWLVGGPGQAAGGAAPIARDRVLLLEFGDDGILLRRKLAKLPVGSSLSSSIDEWTPAESEKLEPMEAESKQEGGEGRAHEAVGRMVIDPAPEEIRPARATRPMGAALLRVRLETFTDQRGQKQSRLIGKRTAAFGVVTHDVYLARLPADVVRDALAAGCRVAGHEVVEAASDVIVRGRIERFEIETPVTLTHWNAVATIDVALDVQPESRPDRTITKRLGCRTVEKTLIGPSREDIEKALVACLGDLAAELATGDLLDRAARGMSRAASPDDRASVE